MKNTTLKVAKGLQSTRLKLSDFKIPDIYPNNFFSPTSPTAWTPWSFYGNGHTRYCGLLRGHHIKTSGIPNPLNYCIIFVKHTSFTNVAAGSGLETHALNHDGKSVGVSTVVVTVTRFLFFIFLNLFIYFNFKAQLAKRTTGIRVELCVSLRLWSEKSVTSVIDTGHIP
jgi:hypothetical protein